MGRNWEADMKPIRAFLFAVGSALLAALAAGPAAAQDPLTEKLNAYVGCINRLSERSFDSRERYFSWVGKKGPTGKERIIYGTYTIYDTSDCKRDVETANAIEPRDAELEAAASDYVKAVVGLEPLLKEANDYYEQEDYKDDKMAKGKALHPRLVAAWDAFAAADGRLRAGVEAIQDERAAEKLGEIEKMEGREARYHVEALMIQAKRVMRTQTETPPDVAKITAAVRDYEAITKATEAFGASSFVNDAKSFLVTAKQLMRRIRDKVPYSSGDKMMLNSGGGGWMVEGSPPRLMRDYNQLVDSYNRGGAL